MDKKMTRLERACIKLRNKMWNKILKTCFKVKKKDDWKYDWNTQSNSCKRLGYVQAFFLILNKSPWEILHFIKQLLLVFNLCVCDLDQQIQCWEGREHEASLHNGICSKKTYCILWWYWRKKEGWTICWCGCHSSTNCGIYSYMYIKSTPSLCMIINILNHMDEYSMT